MKMIVATRKGTSTRRKRVCKRFDKILYRENNQSVMAYRFNVYFIDIKCEVVFFVVYVSGICKV